MKENLREELVYLFMIGVPDETEPHQVAQCATDKPGASNLNDTDSSPEVTKKCLE